MVKLIIGTLDNIKTYAGEVNFKLAKKIILCNFFHK